MGINMGFKETKYKEQLVENYMQLGFGERGYMKDKHGHTIRIYRTKIDGYFRLGWPKKKVSSVV